MKILKNLGILLLVVFAVTTILSLVMPVTQKIKRNITIDARPEEVYEYLSRLSNFNKWAVWNLSDSTIVNTMTGTDGTLGAINNWKGHPEISGEGKISITSLEINQEIEHHISFVHPHAMEADSEYDLEEVNGQTKLNWTFEIATPRPWNIFNLFSSMDREMGKDFDASLINLKTALEKNNKSSQSPGYTVVPLTFPSTRFIIYRQQVGAEGIAAFYAEHFGQLYNIALQAKATPGSPTGLFYEWDTPKSYVDLAAAIPVANGVEFNSDSVQVVEISKSKAVTTDYYGNYTKTADAYKSIEKYLAANGLKQKSPVIEQYITDPAVVKDTAKWLTKIIVLVE